MKNFLFVLLCVFAQGPLNAQTAPAIVWQNTIGGSQYDIGRFVMQTQDGGYLICGDSKSNMSSDKSEDKIGSTDYWIVKLDTFGNIIWDETIGGYNDDIAYAAIECAAGGYIIAGTSLSNSSTDKSENALGGGDIWLVKIDSLGNILWDNTLGGTSSDGFYQIKNCTDGGFIVCAWSRSDDGDKEEASYGLSSDYWIIKFDADGNIEWQNTIGGDGEDYAYCIAQTPDNGYIVGGASYSGISGDKTEEQWGTVSPDYWVLKLDSIGNIEWQNTIGTEAFDEPFDIVVSEKGYLIGGVSFGDVDGDKTEASKGSSDYWILQLDASGNIQWQKSIGGSSQDHLFSIQKDAEGYFLGGWTTSGISGDKTDVNEGNADYWIVKIDTSGNILWQDGIGGSSSDYLKSVSTTPDGAVILAGYSSSDISGDKTENSKGNDDYWVLKLGCTNITFYADTDGDGFGNMLDSISSCTAPPGYITNSTDCNDANNAVYPTATEVCNLIDDNCNTMIDEGFIINTFYLDADGDNFGTSETDSATCLTSIDGFVSDSTDCDDSNPAIYPGAAELPDGLDNNCNDTIDEGIVSAFNIENVLSVTIFPNPAFNYVTLEVQSILPTTKLEISISNILGNEVYAQTVNLVHGICTEVIPLHEKITSGMYTVRIIPVDGETGHKSTSVNLIVE